MKVIKPFFLFVLIYCNFTVNAQNYLRYYELTDSALYFSLEKKYEIADSLYSIAFNNYIGFPINYIDAACNYWIIDSKKATEYIKFAIKYGAYLDNILFAFEKRGIVLHDSVLKSCAKQINEKIECKKCGKIIRRMGRRDLWARFLFNWRIEKVDQQNCEKLISFATKDTMMLNRFYTGIKSNMYLQPILNHQNWETVGVIFNDLRRFVRKGWVHREMLNFFLDEKAFYGQEFKYDSITDRVYLGSKSKSELAIKKHFHYSATGQFSLYHPVLKKQVTIPADPSKSIEEINALRSALFLSPLELYIKSNPHKLYPTVEELKNMFVK